MGGGDMVILLHFCASSATRSKYFLSCPKLLLGLPNLAYHMGGEHADLSYCYKWQILNEESRARVYLVHEISNCVPGSLGILAAEPP